MTRELNTKSIILDVLFTIFTFGLFNVWVQFRQIYQTNSLVNEDEKYSAFFFFILIIVTLGFYLIWHEFRMTRTLHKRLYGDESMEIELLCGVGTILGLWFVVDSYQQHLLNQIIKSVN